MIFDKAAAVDFDILTAKEMRDVLKSKAHCLRAGFPPDHSIIQTLNEFRDHYLQRVGLSTYLSQMLGEFGKAQMQYCTLFSDTGDEISVSLNGAHNQPVQRFIARRFSITQLPFRIEIQLETNEDKPSRMEVRYL